MERKKLSSLHIKKKPRTKAPCPVWEANLYHNEYYSKRVGLFDVNTPDHEIIGWSCPKCQTEFDNKDNIMYIYGEDSTQGSS